MVKFTELLEYLGLIDGQATCSCCQKMVEKPEVFKKEEEMVILCTECKAFLEELLE